MMSLKIFLLLCALSICSAQNSTDEDESAVFKPLLDANDLYEAIMGNLGDTDAAKLLAIEMVDASTKYPSGFFAGGLVDMGNFDQCVNIHRHDVYGKYCTGIQFTSLFFENIADNVKTDISYLLIQHKELTARLRKQVNIDNFVYRMAVCIPHNMSLIGIPSEFIFLEDLCITHAEDHPLTGAAVVTLSVFGFVFGIAIASTIYDIVIRSKNKKTAHWTLTAFSYVQNTCKLFEAKDESNLGCLRGIKSICMFWVMWAHYAGDVAANAMNMHSIVEMEENPFYTPLFNGQVSVDTFLLMGGLLTTYSYLLSTHNGRKVNIPMLYLHRYIRLTPIYVFVMLFCRNLVDYSGNGPFWIAISKMLTEPCQDGWWSNLLYLGNYLHKDVCVGQSYYLHIDMQLFFLSPLLLYPFLKYTKFVLGAIGILWLSSLFVVYFTAIATGAGAFALTMRALEDFTFTTHTRYGTYLIGMLTGYLIFRYKIGTLKFKLTTVQTLLAWILTLTTSTVVLFSAYGLLNNTDANNSKVLNALYVTVERPFWCVAISAMIFLCVTGHGGVFNRFLSCTVFDVMAKLSYSLFLVHLPMIGIRVASSKSTTYISDFGMFHGFFGDCVFFFLVAFVFSLTFESPVIIIEKHLLGKRTSEKNKESKVQEVVQVQESISVPAENGA